MKTLAAFIVLIARIANCNPVSTPCPNCFTGPTGPTLKPIDQCNQADTCAIFGGWRIGNFRVSSDPTQFVQCTGTEVFYCKRCPRNDKPKNAADEYLVFNEKCNMCIRSGEQCTPYTNGPTGTPIAKVLYDKDFCNKPPRNGQLTGNFADPLYPNWYYTCVYNIAYHMPCAANQFFNSTCNACTLVGDYHP